MKNFRFKIILTVLLLTAMLVAAFTITSFASPRYISVALVHGDSTTNKAVLEGESLTLPTPDAKVGGTVYGWFDKHGNFYNCGDSIHPTENMELYCAEGGEIALSGSLPLSISKGFSYIKLKSSITINQTIQLNDGILYIDLNGNNFALNTEGDGFVGKNSGLILANSSDTSATLNHFSGGEEAFCLQALLSLSPTKEASCLTFVAGDNVSIIENMNLISVQNNITAFDGALNVDIYGADVTCKKILRSAGISNGSITIHDGYSLSTPNITISKGNDGSWYFKSPRFLTPQKLTVSTYDENELSCEYNYSLTFTPDSQDDTAGTLKVVDPLNSENSGTYKYTINEDGTFTFENTSIEITKDSDNSWYFKNADLGKKQLFVSELEEDTPSGKYEIKMKYSFVFTPKSSESNVGTVTVIDPFDSEDEKNSGVFEYRYTTGASLTTTGEFLFEDLGTADNVLTFTIFGGSLDLSASTSYASDYSRYKVHVYGGTYSSDVTSFFPHKNYTFKASDGKYVFNGCNHNGTLIENAPDCTSDVTLYHICEYCENVYTKRYPNGVGHSYVPTLSQEIINTPEQTTHGCYTLDCSRCDATQTTYTFPDPSTVYVTVGYMWDGEEIYKRVPAIDLFSITGTEVKSFSVDALTHDILDKDGKVSSTKSVPQEDVFYVEIPLGSTVVYGNYANDTPTGVFLRNEHLKKIELPVSMKTIQKYAFSSMPNLETVIGLEYVSDSIGDYAFMQDADSKLFIEHLVLNAKTIGKSSFQNTRMVTLTYGSNVSSIGERAFAVSEGVESVLCEVFVEGCLLNEVSVATACQNARKSHSDGHQYDGQSIVYMEHDYSSVNIPSTCISLGYDLLTCSRCSISVKSNFSTAYAAHTYIDYYEAPTCQTYGKEGSICTVEGCGHIDVKNNIPKDPDNHLYNAGEVKFVDPAYGGTCSLVHPYYTLAQCACATKAIEPDTKENRSETIFPPSDADHNWDVKVISLPNCGVWGLSERTCTECQLFQKVPAEPVGKHTWQKIPDAENPPTCVRGEVGVYHCTVCNREEAYSLSTSFNPNNHEHVVSTVVSEPTVEAYGQIKHQCTDCNTVYYETTDKLPAPPKEAEQKLMLFGFIDVSYLLPFISASLSIFGISTIGATALIVITIILSIIVGIVVLVVVAGGVLAIIFTFTSKKNKARGYKFRFNTMKKGKTKQNKSVEEQLAAMHLVEEVPPDIPIDKNGSIDEEAAWTAYVDAINKDYQETVELSLSEEKEAKDTPKEEPAKMSDTGAWNAYVDALNKDFEETMEISLSQTEVESFSMDDIMQDTVLDLSIPSLEELEAEELAKQAEEAALAAESTKSKKSKRKSKKAKNVEEAEDEPFDLGDGEPLFTETSLNLDSVDATSEESSDDE